MTETEAPAKADPAAIDLDAIKSWSTQIAPIPDLIAAVEALRERVTETESRYKLYKHIAKSVRGALDGKHTQRDILREFDLILARAEAAEARVVELTEALEKLSDFAPWGGTDFAAFTKWVQGVAEAALAAAPSEALARARAKNQAYLERNHLVAVLARLYPSGIRRTDIKGWSPDWHGYVYIDLPTGQISYHYHDSHAPLFEGLPAYEGEWDGHDKEMVHKRLAKLDAPDRSAKGDGT